MTNSRRHKSSSVTTIPSPLPRHADPHERSKRKEQEKKHGGFSWMPGVALALVGFTMLQVEREIHRKNQQRGPRAGRRR